MGKTFSLSKNLESVALKLFFLSRKKQRTLNGTYGLRFATVGARRMSTGHSAPLKNIDFIKEKR